MSFFRTILNNKLSRFIALSTVATVLSGQGCAVLERWPRIIEGDVYPPVLVNATSPSPTQIELTFDQAVRPDEDSISVDPPSPIADIESRDHMVSILFSEPLAAGVEYWVDAVVADDAGNTTGVSVNAYAPNDRLPDVLINEFTCEGSKRHPDVTELYVSTEGNMAGITIYEGTKKEWDDKFVFGSLDVEAGDYIVIHWKPEGTAEEKNETVCKSASGGLDASPTGWDVWVDGGDGIPNTTGCLTLYDQPRGTLIDAVLYSAKSYDPADDKRGFYRRRELEWFLTVVEAGHWVADGGLVTPESGIDPDPSTATRSICRIEGAPDTNSPDDWHIVPSGGYTFGEPNSTEVYNP